MRGEHSLRVSESRVLRKIFGATRDKVEVTGDQSRFHNEKIYNLYSSPNFLDNQITKDGRGGTCSTHGGENRCIPSFGGETKGKEKTWKV
jgi:hypothetical protein